jgi:hypothetical protein
MSMLKPHLAGHRLDLDQGRATPAGYLSGINAEDPGERYR